MLLAVKGLWLSFSFVRAGPVLRSDRRPSSPWEQLSDKPGEAFVRARWSEQAAQTERRAIFLKNHRDWIGFLSIQLITESC